MMNPASSVSDFDLITFLQNRIKELESENAKLSSQLSNCHCQKRKENGNGNANAVAEELEGLKLEGEKAARNESNERLSGFETREVRQFPKRYVALKVMYFGQRYFGFASEARMDPTVESEIFRALMKTKLIDRVDKKEMQYSRCGRTDKGVSSVGQEK
ncbi:hypothetical protein ACH5RR_034447 [Cinchona calisaya]|uniref:tRNA pseudouridine synthase n=1 Tax=Cinchona calisaya TaxID=153742 RepID=A0ABD2YAZ1_9GENT